MVQLAQWSGALAGARTNSAETTLDVTVMQSKAGSSGAFLGVATDKNNYWIKASNNCQGDRVPVTEQIVGRVGALIGAPTCRVRTIDIPGSLAGFEFRGGARLEAGIAHASLAVDGVSEVGVLLSRSEDDNRRRHCGIFALYDWCWGGDPQWLVAGDTSFHSHDHGWYLPPVGPSWSMAELLKCAPEPHEYSDDSAGIGQEVADEVAQRLEAVTHPQLVAALAAIPTSWNVTDNELEHVGFFLESRIKPVAARLRSRFMGGKV